MSERENTLTVLIDDARRFRDARPCRRATSSAAGLALLKELADERIDHLWLDHGLVGDDTVMPVVDHSVRATASICTVHVHTANVPAGQVMMRRLTAAGYTVVRSYDLRMWVW